MIKENTFFFQYIYINYALIAIDAIKQKSLTRFFKNTFSQQSAQLWQHFKINFQIWLLLCGKQQIRHNFFCSVFFQCLYRNIKMQNFITISNICTFVRFTLGILSDILIFIETAQKDLNPFQANAPFLYPLKTNVFRACRKGTLA